MNIRMIKDRGIDALINECLIAPVFSMGALIIAYACALLSYLYLVFTAPEYNQDGDFTPVVVAFAFLIGLQVCHIFTTPLSSGIDTIFVACAWDPEVLMRDHPDLYARMISVYPHVQTAIHAWSQAQWSTSWLYSNFSHIFLSSRFALVLVGGNILWPLSLECELNFDWQNRAPGERL